MSFTDPATHDFPQWVRCGEYIYYGRDIVSFGDELTPENLNDAYRRGIFPWYMEGVPLPWYCPEYRAILDFDEAHIPASLRRARNKSEFTFTIDRDFRGVITECSLAHRPGQSGTWIMPEFIDAYTELHRRGIAHSVEAWDAAGKLVGGVYGVDAGGVFCGESMFYKRPNASKLALLFFIEHARLRGSSWLDAQVMTPHMKALGAREIPRNQFLRRLKQTQEKNLTLFDQHG
jgi:leucyl/phenylalanyl-tRNA---protein transferase